MPSFRLTGSVLVCVLCTLAGAQTIVNTVPGTFVDLLMTGGTQIVGIADDSISTINTSVGNVMFPAGSVTVCNNGWAMSNPTPPGSGPYTESDIPLPTGMPTGFTSAGIASPGSGLLLPWWDDLYPISLGTAIYWQQTAGVLYIMWKNENHFSDGTLGAGITFEIQVFSNPGSGPWIQFLYNDTTFTGSNYGTANDNGASATIGYVKSNSAVGGNAKWSFDIAGAVGPGTVLSIYPPLGLYGLATASPATTPVGSSTQLTVAISATTPPNPPTGVAVTVDLTAIGASPQAMYDDGLNGGDVTAGDNTFSFIYAVPFLTPPGGYLLPWSATDSAARTTSGVMGLTVIPIPPGNDGCVTPIVLSAGVNGPFSNAAATNSGVTIGCGSGGYNDVWFSYPCTCSGIVTITTGCGGFDTILAAYPSCGGVALACNDTTAGCGFGGSTISFPTTAFTTYLLQVASYYSGASGSFSITITQGGPYTLAFSQPGGIGSGNLQIDLANGPPSGLYFFAATLNQGAFPSGWFLGVDIPFPDLSSQISAGFPFFGPLSSCGAQTLGFGGLYFLAGFPIYSVAVGVPQPGPLVPSVHTTPITFTIL